MRTRIDNWCLAFLRDHPLLSGIAIWGTIIGLILLAGSGIVPGWKN
jgi:hypothetical protein